VSGRAAPSVPPMRRWAFVRFCLPLFVTTTSVLVTPPPVTDVNDSTPALASPELLSLTPSRLPMSSASRARERVRSRRPRLIATMEVSRRRARARPARSASRSTSVRRLLRRTSSSRSRSRRTSRTSDQTRTSRRPAEFPPSTARAATNMRPMSCRPTTPWR
jgi:hypothetical protein